MSLFQRNRYRHLEDTPGFGRQFLIFGWELTKVIVISLAIIIPVRYFLIKPFYVKGASMEPNFHDYEYLIVDELSYRFALPQRGDVVVFRYPQDPRQFFIKRVIGLPGETVKMVDGRITIINKLHPEGLIIEESYLSKSMVTNGPNEVAFQQNQYYLMGDNRTSSLDSRIFGPVDKSAVIGKVLFRGWPPNRAGLLLNNLKYNL